MVNYFNPNPMLQLSELLKDPDDPFFTWVCYGLVFGSIFLMPFFMVSLQSIFVRFPYCAQKWQKPQWSISPFVFNDPLLFFNFAGYCILIQGVGCLCAAILSSWGLLFPGIYNIVAGGIILISCRICFKKFNYKYEPGT